MSDDDEFRPRSGNRTRSKRKSKLPRHGRGVLCPYAYRHTPGTRNPNYVPTEVWLLASSSLSDKG